MAKFSVTVNTDNPAEIAAVIAALGGGGAVPALASGGAVPALGGDDDDNAPVNTNAPAVDSAGMPWDARIHAKSRTVKADGTWKRGRGVTDEQAARVEAELRGHTMQAPPVQPMQAQPAPFAPPAQPPQQPAFPSPSAPAVPQQGGGVALTPAQQPQTQQPPVNAPTPVQPAGTLDFGGLMAGLQKAMGAGKLTVDMLPALVNEINAAWQTSLGAITDLGQPQNAQMVPWVKDLFVSKGIWVD